MSYREKQSAQVLSILLTQIQYQNQPCRAVCEKIHLTNGLFPGSVMFSACPRPLFHGSNSCPIVELHGPSTVCSIMFAYKAATPAGYKEVEVEAPMHHAGQPAVGLPGLHRSVQQSKTALWLFHKGKPTRLSPMLFPSPTPSLLKQPPFTPPVGRFLRVLQHRERSGEARAVAISAALTAASADNEALLPHCY